MAGEGNGNPLQYSCLENLMDRGAWQAMVHRVAAGQTWLKGLSTWRCRHREQTGEHSVGRRGWDGSREQHGNIHMTVCRIDSRWEFAVWLRELKPGLCDNLEEWDGVGGGKEIQEGGDRCIPMADSCWCVAETNTYYEAIVLQLKINKLKTRKEKI